MRGIEVTLFGIIPYYKSNLVEPIDWDLNLCSRFYPTSWILDTL